MPKIKTLILSGANNHDWTRSTPFVRELLEKSGKFEVVVTDDPSETLEDKSSLEGVQLIFMDYNGPEWSDEAKKNFEAAIKGGVGMVVLHAADNAFTGWVEYEKMVGLMWREGASHGSYHTIDVRVLDRTHPIMRGVADFKTPDELYHKLTHMHNVPMKVLAVAYSKPEEGGTGQDEPVVTTTQYGEGRIAHVIIGHVWEGGGMDSFQTEGFQQLTLRSSEWAATGTVID